MATPSRITPERVALAGAALASLAYLQDLRYDFILDDVPLILMNEAVTSLRHWKTAFADHIASSVTGSMPVEVTAVHYRPVYRLWQMLNAQCFGLVFPWWHLTSLLLHLAVVLLVYQLGRKLLKDEWTAALASALFAVHPIHAESVAYVTASSDLLVTLFSLLAFLAYFRFREEGGTWLAYSGALFAAALAMLSKETAVMFPWLLVAYEWLKEMPPNGSEGAVRDWRRFGWTLPFFGIVGVYVAVRSFLFGLNAGPGPGNRLHALLDMPLVLVVYLRNLLWPFRLSFFYPVEWSSRWNFWRGGAVALSLIAAASLWRWSRKRSALRLQLAWAAILFVPAVLGVYAFVPDGWVHDRHMYFASVPVCIVLAALLTQVQWSPKTTFLTGAGLFAVLFVDLAMIQVPRFTDSAVIYASALKVAPSSFRAHSYYAQSLWLYGRKEEALNEFQLVTELAPKAAGAREAYGAALAQIGRDAEAQAQFEAALQEDDAPAFRAFILCELAQLELKHSEISRAEVHLAEAIQLAPGAPDYHAFLAEALRLEGRVDEAEAAMKIETGIRLRTAAQQRQASSD